MLLPHGVRGRVAAWGVLLALAGCSPTLDWREVRPEDSGALAMFPCKPSTDARMVTLADARVRMVLVACRAGDTNWGLAYADMADPAKVTPALQALRAASAGNLNGRAAAVGPVRIEGMTPNAQAERVRVQGTLPDGTGVGLEAMYFARGTRVYQATAMGSRLDPDAVAQFFDGLKLPA